MATQKAFSAGSEFPALAADTLRLYSMRLCPFAQRAVLVLAHKNIPHETININLSNKPDWFWKINPLGKVPAIQKNDKVVYESVVVCEYLDEVYPGEKVVPSDPYQRARDKMFLERYSTVVNDYYRLLLGKDEAVKSDVANDIVKGFHEIEEELRSRNSPFFGGDKPMLVDFVVWPHVERLVVLATWYPAITISRNQLPQLSTWIETISSVPVVKCTISKPENHVIFFKTYKDGKPDCDVGLEE